MNFKDKVVVVVGGTSGIGKIIAKQFIDSNAKVSIAGVDREKGKNIAIELGDDCIFIKTDVCSEQEVENLLKETINKYKKVDILVNSAGVYSRNQSDITKLSIEDFQHMMDVNFRGIFLTTKIFIPYLLKTKGNIINISSSLGLAPEKESSIYCSSKAAVNMFTKAMALNYADKDVRINAICPGPINTPMLSNNIPDKDELKEYIDAIPMKRVGSAEEVANLALFLASQKSSYITGGIYTVDGGESLK